MTHHGTMRLWLVIVQSMCWGVAGRRLSGGPVGAAALPRIVANNSIKICFQIQISALLISKRVCVLCDIEQNFKL